jgi:hypothetical protein
LLPPNPLDKVSQTRFGKFMSTAKYPLGTVIAYGPNDQVATKLVAAVFKRPGQQEPEALKRWFSQSGDVRQDPVIGAEVAGFLKQHGVTQAATSRGIFGCPHEEGIDSPLGGTCPLCPFWANRKRGTPPEPAPGSPAVAPAYFPPALIVAQLSAIRETQPVNALAAADLHQAVLTPTFLDAIERGLADPLNSFEKDGMLFNYATYFLAKWREPRAYPLFIRWFSLPGEEALELGGDTIMQHGSRLLASVCGSDLEPLKSLILNRGANPECRAQAVEALAVLVAWNEQPRQVVEEYLKFLAREGLERQASVVWNHLANACVALEARAVFPEIRRACEEGLVEALSIRPEILDEVERAPAGSTFKQFAATRPRISNVAAETRWWAGFHQQPAESASSVAGVEDSLNSGETSQPRIAPAKVGRNDPCPCGSGKKYKKCCGK